MGFNSVAEITGLYSFA